MRISILSILMALTLVIAGPLAFAGQDQEAVNTETIAETSEVVDVSEVADTMGAEEVVEDCTNSADDDGDTKIDCDDSDCAEDTNCKGGY